LIAGGTTSMGSCENGGAPMRSFQATWNHSGCGFTPVVIWYYRLPSSMNDFAPYPTQPAAGQPLLFNFNHVLAVPQSFDIKAKVEGGLFTYATSNTISISFVNQGYCP